MSDLRAGRAVAAVCFDADVDSGFDWGFTAAAGTAAVETVAVETAAVEIAAVETNLASGSFLARRIPSASLVEKSFLLITATSPQ